MLRSKQGSSTLLVGIWINSLAVRSGSSAHFGDCGVVVSTRYLWDQARKNNGPGYAFSGVEIVGCFRYHYVRVPGCSTSG